MDDDHKYNWDEMIKQLFHINDHRINTLNEWWNGDETEEWNKKQNNWEYAERF